MISLQQNVVLMQRGARRNMNATTSRGQTYLIGFQNWQLASHVRRNLHPNNDITLERKYYFDVSKDVKVAMLDMNLPIMNVSDKIIIDVDASLHIPKVDFDTYDNINTEMITATDFLMMPFKDGMGIVLPFQIQYEDQHKFVLSSYVIDCTQNNVYGWMDIE
jgi:hypothetical protein